ncbi:MAG: hypothetical protein ACOYM3_33355 [Terrimicrobiaceae bacterium]
MRYPEKDPKIKRLVEILWKETSVPQAEIAEFAGISTGLVARWCKRVEKPLHRGTSGQKPKNALMEALAEIERLKAGINKFC